MGVCLDEDNTSIVSQFYPQGSCYKVFLRDRRDVSWKELLKVVKGAAAGILHLHAENYIHRDIASRNILISDSFEGIVTDFGMSRLQLRDGSQSITYLGPVKWMAPESIRDKIISKATDVYMFGSFMWELIVRDTPYADEDPFAAALKVINEGCTLEMPTTCHPGYLSLMEQCLRTAPEERPNFEEILTRLEDLYDEAELKPNLSFASPSEAGRIALGKPLPQGIYVDSRPIFDFASVQLDTRSKSPFSPGGSDKTLDGRDSDTSITTIHGAGSGGSSTGANSVNSGFGSPSNYGSPSSKYGSDASFLGTNTTVGYFETMPVATATLRPKTVSRPMDSGYMEAMPASVSINRNGYLFTTSALISSSISSPSQPKALSPQERGDITPSVSSSSISTSVGSGSGTPAAKSTGSIGSTSSRSNTSPGRPKSAAAPIFSCLITEMNQKGPFDASIQKNSPTNSQSTLGRPHSSTIPPLRDSSSSLSSESSAQSSNSLKLGSKGSISPPRNSSSQSLSGTSQPASSPSSNHSAASPAITITGSTPRKSTPNSGPSNGSQMTFSSSISPPNTTSSLLLSSSSPPGSTRFGNTTNSPMRSNIVLYSNRVVACQDLLGWKPQFYAEHTFKSSRMTSSAPARAISAAPTSPLGNSSAYPNNNRDMGNNNHNKSQLSQSMHYQPQHQPQRNVSLPTGLHAHPNYQHAPLSVSAPHGSHNISSSASQPHMGPQQSGQNQMAGGYPSSMPTSPGNHPGNPFSLSGHIYPQLDTVSPQHMNGGKGGNGGIYAAPVNGPSPPYFQPQPSNSSSVSANQPMYYHQPSHQPMHNNANHQPQVPAHQPQVSNHQQQHHVQQHHQQQHFNPYGQQQASAYPQQVGPVYYGAQPSYQPMNHPISQPHASSTSNQAYSKPLPKLPPAQVTSSTYTKPLPATPDHAQRVPYGPSGY